MPATTLIDGNTAKHTHAHTMCLLRYLLVGFLIEWNAIECRSIDFIWICKKNGSESRDKKHCDSFDQEKYENGKLKLVKNAFSAFEIGVIFTYLYVIVKVVKRPIEMKTTLGQLKLIGFDKCGDARENWNGFAIVSRFTNCSMANNIQITIIVVVGYFYYHTQVVGDECFFLLLKFRLVPSSMFVVGLFYIKFLLFIECLWVFTWFDGQSGENGGRKIRRRGRGRLDRPKIRKPKGYSLFCSILFSAFFSLLLFSCSPI